MGRGEVVTHLHTHFHICLAMKKQKTAKFTRTQDALHAAKTDMEKEIGVGER